MFTLKSHVSEAATAKKRDPAKYRWFTMTKGRAKFASAHDEFELEIGRGENYGLKFFKGSYFLVDESDLTVQFKLTVDEANKLMSNSKGYNGKIAGKTVRPGDDHPKPTKSIAGKVDSKNVNKFLESTHGVALQKDEDNPRDSYGKTTPKIAQKAHDDLLSQGWTDKPASNRVKFVTRGGKAQTPSKVLVSPDGKKSIMFSRKGPKTFTGDINVGKATQSTNATKPKPAASSKKLPVSSKAGLARGLSKRFGVEFQDIGNGSHNTKMPAKDVKRMKEELVSEGWTHKEGKDMKAAGGGKGSHHPEFLVSPDGKRSIALKRKSAKTYDGGVSIMR